MQDIFPYESYLLLAFRKLEVFSIPSIGTFVRKTTPAQLDEEKKTIYPPNEYIEFKPQQFRQPDALAELLAASLNISVIQARQVSVKIGAALLAYLEAQGELKLPEIGKIYITQSQELCFEPFDTKAHLATFGLAPVTFTKQASPGATSHESQEKSNSYTGATVALAPAPEVFSSFSKDPSKKTIYAAIGGVLFLGLIALIIIYLSPLRTPQKNILSPPIAQPALEAKDSLQLNAINAENEKAENPTSSERNQKEKTQNSEKINSAQDSNSPLAIERKKGFYIIVAQAPNEQEALNAVKYWQRQNFKVYLVAGKTPGSYRISVGYYEQKEKAIARLEQLQREKKIPRDSWVFKQL
jgi:hypothetical protein